MKVIVDLCVVPIGVGVHLAPYIAACEKVLTEAGLKIQLHPNGTAIEGERGWLEAEPEQARRQFWLMPLMHSEDLAVQEAALPLFERFSDPRTADFARRHRDVIARFGRFPHRNALLGRVSSAEELAFLQTPGSRF